MKNHFIPTLTSSLVIEIFTNMVLYTPLLLGCSYRYIYTTPCDQGYRSKFQFIIIRPFLLKRWQGHSCQSDIIPVRLLRIEVKRQGHMFKDKKNGDHTAFHKHMLLCGCAYGNVRAVVLQRLHQARLMMDRLRACIVANYYSSAGQSKLWQVTNGNKNQLLKSSL